MGTYYPGTKVNPLDLSPNYSGSIMALTNCLGAVTGIAAPVFVGYMTPNVSKYLLQLHVELKFLIKFNWPTISTFHFQTSVDEWRIVFWVTLVVFLATTIVFCFGASGEIQLWNYPREWKDPENDEALEMRENNENKSM